MEFYVWHYWIIAAILLFMLEIVTPFFVTFNFGIGALLATVVAALGMGVEWQIILFCMGTLVSFFTVRPLALKYVYRKSDNRPTNNLAIIGRKGEVVTTINNFKNSGEVKIDGDIWRAQNVNNEIIEEGEIVTIVDFKSITVFVKKE